MKNTQKGSIDVIRPTATEITLVPTVKNCYLYDPKPEDVTITATRKEGKATVTEAWEGNLENRFDVKVENSSYYVISLKDGAELDHTWTYSATVNAEGFGLHASVKKLSVKMRSAKVTQSPKTVTLLKRDRYSTAKLLITMADPNLSPIDWEKTTEAFDQKNAGKPFDFRHLGGGECVICYAADAAAIKAGTVKIPVYLEGNKSSKPNATLSVSVKLA